MSGGAYAPVQAPLEGGNGLIGRQQREWPYAIILKRAIGAKTKSVSMQPRDGDMKIAKAASLHPRIVPI
jgi:hypothetical protein